VNRPCSFRGCGRPSASTLPYSLLLPCDDEASSFDVELEVDVCLTHQWELDLAQTSVDVARAFRRRAPGDEGAV
jgi:hypothetical protein